MKVFVAGATGAIGRPLVSALAAARHEVVGMTSSDRGLRLRFWSCQRGYRASAAGCGDRRAHFASKRLHTRGDARSRGAGSQGAARRRPKRVPCGADRWREALSRPVHRILLWARRSPCIRNGLAGWKCVARSFRERPNLPANRKAGTGFARFGGSCLALRILLWARNPSRS